MLWRCNGIYDVSKLENVRIFQEGRVLIIIISIAKEKEGAGRLECQFILSLVTSSTDCYIEH